MYSSLFEYIKDLLKNIKINNFREFNREVTYYLGAASMGGKKAYLQNNSNNADHKYYLKIYFRYRKSGKDFCIR